MCAKTLVVEKIALSEVRLQTLVKGKVYLASVGNSEVYVFDAHGRSIVLAVHPDSVDAFEVVGGSFSKLEDPRVTLDMLKRMGVKPAGLPDKARKALAVHAVL
jgi:hypothetical protein